MDTPPYTPPPTGHSSIDSLHIHYCDFAYEHKGPFRMAVADVGESTAKTFAELVPFSVPAALGSVWLTQLRLRLLSGSTMDIYVGKNRRHWSLHRNILCHHSTWFQKQIELRNVEKGGKDISVELFDDDPRAFELLIKWLYQGKIDNVSDMPMDKKWDFADACQQLYILCDKINLPQLKNLAIDQFRKGCNEAGLVPGPEEIKPIYERTPPSSPFRKLVSEIAARQIMDPESESDASKYRQCFEGSPDFAIDVVNAIKVGAGGSLFQDPTAGEGCCYHEHPLGQRCSTPLSK